MSNLVLDCQELGLNPLYLGDPGVRSEARRAKDSFQDSPVARDLCNWSMRGRQRQKPSQGVTGLPIRRSGRGSRYPSHEDWSYNISAC